MRFTLTYLFVLTCSAIFAGSVKDTVQLDEVVKIETICANIHTYDSPFSDSKYKQGKRLSEALGEYSCIYIKNYGNGQLASLAIRGTSATQTEIQWNGVKLNSPSLGQCDLALFQLGMQDELQLARTGYHGTIGGTLKMNNEAKTDSGFSVGGTLRIGSFKTFEVLTDANYGKLKFSGSSKFSYLSSENDFTYHNTFKEGNPRETQKNAAVRQLSFLQDFNSRINAHNEIGIYVWLTEAERQIPPIMSKPDGKESQNDFSLRTMLKWNGSFKNLKLKFTSAYLNDLLQYKNPDALIDETAITNAVRNIFSCSYLFPLNLAWNTEVNYDYERANIQSYGTIKSRNTIGLRTYADYYFLKGFRFHSGFREDLVDEKLSAFAPELALNYSKKDKTTNHTVTAGIIGSRNFRFPTLNDLYWNPGGNRNLKQEKSLNGEIQFKYSYRKIAEVSFSNFYIYVDDWIQWVPQGNIWMPANFKRVFSRGLEASLHLTNATESHPNRFTVHFNASYSFTKATNLDASSEFDLSKGMQLIYVPLHNAVAGLQLQYKRFYIRSVNTFTSKIFTSTDNSQSLNGYFVSDLEAGNDFALKNLDLGFSFRVNNISNTEYQNVVQRPMPGRNFEGTLRFKFHS